MATKFIVVGEPIVPTQKTTFELALQLNNKKGSYDFRPAENDPENYKYVELIATEFGPDMMDLMFAYDSPDNRWLGVLYLGKWNRGN